MGEMSHVEGEDVIITFEKEDSATGTGQTNIINFQAKITNLSMSAGTMEVETVRTFGGNSIQIAKPTGEYEVTFDYVTEDTSFAQINFDADTTAGPIAGTEYRSGSEASKKRYRVILWFLGDGASYVKKTGDSSVVVPKNVGEILRYIFKDCYATTNEEEFSSDEYLKGTITLKCSATDEDGYANVFKEWTTAQGTTALTVLNTTAHKGVMTWVTTAASAAWVAGTGTTATANFYRV